MKEENSSEQTPLVKSDLPEVMYPCVPVEYSEKELTAEGETTQEREIPTELTEEEKEERQKESDKESTALIVFIVLFALMILKFFLSAFRKRREYGRTGCKRN